MRTRISGLSTLCKRIAAILRRCDVETFLSIGHLYADCAPREKRLDMHIDLLRRGEFRDVECVKDIERYKGERSLISDPDLSFSIGRRSSSTSSLKLTSRISTPIWQSASPDMS